MDLLRGAILRSTGLKALLPGAFVAIIIASRSNFLNRSMATTMFFLCLGFSSGPPSVRNTPMGFISPFPFFKISSNSGTLVKNSKSFAWLREVELECFPERMAMKVGPKNIENVTASATQF